MDHAEGAGGPILVGASRELPDTILNSWANSTVTKYLGAFRRWKTWATQHGMTALPAKNYQVAFYFQYLGDNVQSFGIFDPQKVYFCHEFIMRYFLIGLTTQYIRKTLLIKT